MILISLLLLKRIRFGQLDFYQRLFYIFLACAVMEKKLPKTKTTKRVKKAVSEKKEVIKQEVVDKTERYYHYSAAQPREMEQKAVRAGNRESGSWKKERLLISTSRSPDLTISRYKRG